MSPMKDLKESEKGSPYQVVPPRPQRLNLLRSDMRINHRMLLILKHRQHLINLRIDNRLIKVDWLPALWTNCPL